MWAARYLTAKQPHLPIVRSIIILMRNNLTVKTQRTLSSSSTSSSTKDDVDYKSVNRHEPMKLKPSDEKPKGLLYRMAPPKGGTDPPDAKFLAVAAVVCSAGFYAWVIDPPVPPSAAS